MADHMKSALPYIMIAGPTASGKSQLAVDLARRFGGAVINADSMQLYADLTIVTARPQPQEIQDIPHYLFGICDAAHRASVAEWLGLATTAIAFGPDRQWLAWGGTRVPGNAQMKPFHLENVFIK